MRQQRGFTLIELLVVIGILAVLLAITLIAINPAKQFSQANNTKRRSDINAILNAVNQYQADNHGALPGTIPTTATAIGKGAGEVDICAALVTKYLAALPVDPSINSNAVTDCASAYETGYTIFHNLPDNRIIVNAPDAELGETITVER